MSSLKTISLFAAAALILPVGCKKFSEEKRNSESATSGSVVVACDRSFENVLEQEIEVFEYIYPEASILPLYMSEQQCIDSLISGKARMAVTTRELTQSETALLEKRRKKIVQSPIAVDAIALIVNNDNPTKELTVAQLRMIMSGEVTDWSEIDPANRSGAISVIFDENGSSTISCVRQKVMDGDDFGSNVYAQGSNEAVFEHVAEDKGALGIIGVSWLNPDMKSPDLSQDFVDSLDKEDVGDKSVTQSFSNRISVLAIAGGTSLKAYRPFQSYIYDGKYPLVRKIYLISTGYGGSLASGFYAFVTGFNGQKLLRSTGVLPAGVHPRILEVE